MSGEAEGGLGDRARFGEVAVEVEPEEEEVEGISEEVWQLAKQESILHEVYMDEHGVVHEKDADDPPAVSHGMSNKAAQDEPEDPGIRERNHRAEESAKGGCQLLGQEMFSPEHDGLKEGVMVNMTETADVPSFACYLCRKTFTLLSYLKRHIKVTHAGEKKHVCHVCQKLFMCPSHLKAHFTVHSGYKPYSCQVCERPFSQLSYLKKHMIIHTGERPFSCEVCEKRFARKSDFNRHVLIHTGEKPLSCEVCQKRFTQVGNFKTHFKIHMRSKP